MESKAVAEWVCNMLDNGEEYLIEYGHEENQARLKRQAHTFDDAQIIGAGVILVFEDGSKFYLSVEKIR